ncbi:MAG: glycosyltransferase [Deltaproteobacteria bacterium]|nr:glycosyltransferase [Deltaproteobacteria bacterium]
MPPHKVLLFIPHLQQGGAERQILELMTRLPARYAPTLCLYGADEKDRIHYKDYLQPGEPRHVLGVDEMGPVGLKRLVDLLKAERPTILHSYRDKANFWARLAALAVPVPIVLTSVRNRYQGPFYGPAEFVLQRKSDRVLVNSVGIQEELVNWSRVDPDKIQVINNFIDLDKFQPPTDAARRAARQHFGIADHEVALILPGRLAVQKHQLGLGLALAYLKRAGRLPANVRLLLAGRKRDKTYSRLVPTWYQAIGIASHVTYLDPIADMAPLYHAADALVMPSLYEGLPNAVLEAHACALPCVVSHAANRDTIVVDGSTGYEVATLDHRGLAEAIGRMIEHTDAERRAMGARGRTHVAARFHPDRISEETTALYDELIAEKGLA